MACRDGRASQSCLRLGYTGVGFDDMRAGPSSGSGLIALGAAFALMLARGDLELTGSVFVIQTPCSVVCCCPLMIGDRAGPGA